MPEKEYACPQGALGCPVCSEEFVMVTGSRLPNVYSFCDAERVRKHAERFVRESEKAKEQANSCRAKKP